MKTPALLLTGIVAVGIALSAAAADDPIEKRQDVMKGVGKAAKPVGEMLRGEREYDAARVMESLRTFEDAAAVYGDLFPEGSESGGDTEARMTIWTDRSGFEAKLTNWEDAVTAAIAANPATLDDAQPVLGPVFQACKACHEDYRVDKD